MTDYLFKLFSKDKLDSAAKVLYQRARNDVSYMIRAAKNQFYSEVLEGNDMSAKWNAIKSTISSMTSVFPKLRKIFGIPFMGVDYVCKQFKAMLNSKATELDMISIKLLKLSSSTVSKHITRICNLSIQTGIFPDNWKIETVVPIFKSGNISDLGNYRPI